MLNYTKRMQGTDAEKYRHVGARTRLLRWRTPGHCYLGPSENLTKATLFVVAQQQL